MPVEIIVGTNSYLSMEEAVAYFNNRLYADAWNNSNDDDRARSLITATASIDRMTYKGRKKDSNQILQFPRAYRINPLYHPQVIGNLPDYENVEGWYLEKEVSERVKASCCEEALAILERGNNQRRKLQAEGVRSYSIGKLSETFVAGAGKGLLSTESKDLLRPYLAGSVRIR